MASAGMASGEAITSMTEGTDDAVGSALSRSSCPDHGCGARRSCRHLALQMY